MEINNNLASQVGRNAIYDNGQARVRETAPEAGPKKEMPSAIYHGSNDQIPDVGYGRPHDLQIKIESRVGETDEAYSARMAKMTDLLYFELGEKSIDLKHGYDAATATLSPQLQDKDWGFSVSGGKLNILENSDKLSDRERGAIKSAFADYSVEYLSNEVADTVIAGLEAERGPHETTRGLGKYDLNESNFGEIIDLRAYLNSHVEGGKYELQSTARTNMNDDSTIYMFSGIHAMFDQFSVGAEPKFAKYD